jgi:tetrapyrrole methylase family protein/MazG family protein
LRNLIARLRGPGGCPWDRAQGKADIGRYLLEETHEVLDALEDSPEHLKEELGDLLFHILFLSRMAEEAGEFTATDILEEITAKMIRRHPHVFGDKTVDGVEEVRANWEQIKTEVEHKVRDNHALTDRIPRSLPALSRAQRITERAAEAGFDWKDTEGVLDKVAEEITELRGALRGSRPEEVSAELGDLIFTLVNLCRFLQVDAETALNRSLEKFIRRFLLMERRLAVLGMSIRGTSMAELDRLWEQIKSEEGHP